MRVKVLYSAPPRPQFGEVLRLFVVDPSGPVVRAVRAGEVVELAEFGRYERALLAQGKLAEVVERIDPVDLAVEVRHGVGIADELPGDTIVDMTTTTDPEPPQVDMREILREVAAAEEPAVSAWPTFANAVGAPQNAETAPAGKLYVDDVVAAAGIPTASHPSEVTAPPAPKRRPGRPRKSRPE
jgi:hypothetical protein